MGVAGHRGRPAGARIDHRGGGVSGVRPAVPRRTAGVPARALHRRQHRGDDAFSLDGIQSSSRPIGESVSTEEMRANEATISNIRLWRPDVLRDNYISLQRPLVLRVQRRGRRPVRRRRATARPDGLDARGEPGRHPGGREDLAERPPPVHARVRGGDVPGEHRDRGPTRLHAPRHPADRRSGAGGQRSARLLRRGRGAPGDAFVVVDTGTEELDFQGTATDDQAQETFSYDGDGGIPVGGLFQRACSRGATATSTC